MKRIWILIIVLFFAPCVALAMSPQEEFLTQRLAELLPHDAHWGVAVVDLKSGTEIVNAGNVNESLSPASLVKLFVAGAVLEREGEGKPLTLSTEILRDGEVDHGTLRGNIYLRGNGNCLLSAEDLKQAGQALRDKGITAITGGVVADATRFDTRGLERTRKGAGYAPASALGLDLHTVSVCVAPGETGKPPRVTVEPPNSDVRFAVSARTVAGSKTALSVTQSDVTGYRISGDISRESVSLHWRFPLTDPARYAAQSFMTILNQAGIRIQGEASIGATPPDAVMVTTMPGPGVKGYIDEMNMNSLNVAADNLLLALGSGSDGLPGTRDKGLALLREHHRRHNLMDNQAIIADGSGLLPANRITARAMARYLAEVAKQPWYSSLLHSLPRAGLDGTLRSSGFKSEHFRAKTGSLENVAALAGYGIGKDGREIAFAFIANSTRPLPPNARNAGDVVMRLLAE